MDDAIRIISTEGAMALTPAQNLRSSYFPPMPAARVAVTPAARKTTATMTMV